MFTLSLDDLRSLGWTKQYERFNRDFDSLKERIARQRGADRDLRVLVEAGADRNAILELLVHILHDAVPGWRTGLGEQQRAYKDVALKLRGAVKAVERVVSNPVSRGEFWLMLLNPGVRVDIPARQDVQSRALYMLTLMKAYEEYSLGMARSFGQLSRTQAPLLRNRVIGELLTYIHKATGRNFDNEVSRLLTDAHEAVGKTRPFSPEMLKKVRQRHISH